MKRYSSSRGTRASKIILETHFSPVIIFREVALGKFSNFFKSTFGLDKEIPHINKTGYSKSYKDLFTPKPRAKIEELEAPILKLGNYKYL